MDWSDGCSGVTRNLGADKYPSRALPTLSLPSPLPLPASPSLYTPSRPSLPPLPTIPNPFLPFPLSPPPYYS